MKRSNVILWILCILTLAPVTYALNDFALFCNHASAPVTLWRNYANSLTWSGISNLPTACSSTSGVYLNDKYYQVCGWAGSRYAYAQIWDGSSWMISLVAHPDGGVNSHSCAVWNGKIVISGGNGSNYTTVYDTNASTWVHSTPMPISYILYTSMASVNGKCYLFGGVQSSYAYYSTYEWTPGDPAMIQKSDMPGMRCRMMVAEYNGKIYAFGGATTADYLAGSNTIWVYDPTGDVWSVKSAHLSTGRCSGVAVTIDDKIYIIAGYANNSISDLVEVYDPQTDSITTGPQLLFKTTTCAGAGSMIGPYQGEIIVSGGSYGGSSLGTANRGEVLLDTEVQPASLGSIKASFR